MIIARLLARVFGAGAAIDARMRACRPSLSLTAGGPNGLRTEFYLLRPVGLSDAGTGGPCRAGAARAAGLRLSLPRIFGVVRLLDRPMMTDMPGLMYKRTSS